MLNYQNASADTYVPEDITEQEWEQWKAEAAQLLGEDGPLSGLALIVFCGNWYAKQLNLLGVPATEISDLCSQLGRTLFDRSLENDNPWTTTKNELLAYKNAHFSEGSGE